jgi:hypothetical protein
VANWRDIPTLTQIRDRVRFKNAESPAASSNPSAQQGLLSASTKVETGAGAAHIQPLATQEKELDVETPMTKKRNQDRHPLEHKWRASFS